MWEAITDPSLQGLGNVMLVVDTNRQSLDRVIPDQKIKKVMEVFDGAGWHVVEAKYGSLLTTAFRRPGGARRCASTSTPCRTRSTSRCSPTPARSCASASSATPATTCAGSSTDVAPDAAGTARAEPRRPRPRRAARRLPGVRRRDRPAERRVRLHRQGLGPADRRRSAEPRRAADRHADRRAARLARPDDRRRSGTVSTRRRRPGSVCGDDRRRAEQRPVPPRPVLPIPDGDERAGRRLRVDAGVVRPRAHPARRRRRRGRAHRDDVAGRQRVDEPRRVDQQGRRVRPARGRRLPRRRAAAALEAVTGRPAHRARDQRDEPVPAAARARASATTCTAATCCRSGPSTTRSCAAGSTP